MWFVNALCTQRERDRCGNLSLSITPQISHPFSSCWPCCSYNSSMPLLFHMATIQQRDKTGSEKTSHPAEKKPVSCDFTAKNKHLSTSATGFLAILFAVNCTALIGRLTACSLLRCLSLWVHQLLHHQVYINDGTEVQSPVEEAVAHKLRDKRPHDGECEPLR